MNFSYELYLFIKNKAMLRSLTGIFCLFFLVMITLNAQPDGVKNPEQFVFPDFSVGVVKMKGKEKVALALNYNVVTEKMVFRQKNQIYDMVEYSRVDTVYIHERKFVPYNNIFYEVLVNAPVSLFIQHKGNIKPPPRPAAYGGTSEVSSSTYVSNIRLGNDVYRLANDETVIIEPDPLIWIRKDNEMHAILNQKSLLKIFSDRKNEVKEFISQNRVDSKNPGHLIGVVNFYNGLSQERRP